MENEVILRLEEGNAAQFQKMLADLFPNHFDLDRVCTMSIENQDLAPFESVAIVYHEGIEMVEFILKPHCTFAQGIEFYMIWAPDYFIQNPPSILCWWD